MPPVYGGAPKCRRCDKSVYMAEQVIGPGGAYHRSCLTCKECNKRLDSTTLTERDNEAYCKVCYNRKWGPKGYGFASGAAFLSTDDKMPKQVLEERQQQQQQQQFTSPPPQPPRPGVGQTQPQQQPREYSSSPASSPAPRLPSRPSSASPTRTPPPATAVAAQNTTAEPPSTPPMTSFWSNNSKTSSVDKPAIPPKPVLGGTKPAYLNASYTPRKINMHVQNDTCTKCGKAVYAAELALGAGNKYHKFCLKCSDCGKLLNSTNMVDKDFDLYCRGCYSKAFGPKGYGYGNLLTPEGATR
ncbi:hypothetical protein BCR43DRAFT_493805 [Syncephalastrum racemosum]|uniref:LIM zinc-binding domain-containing protein n=1 Tax=Syncephalastrum racemosum TaxID=13706 RepID=A0A1X2HB69_SYNRA|nr:hypothetical protein BCR43DRAFT_493805 [Syncephalastrum racemosum]